MSLKDDTTFNDVGTLFDKPINELIMNDIGKWRNKKREIQKNMGNVHKIIRNHYNNSIYETAMNIYPLIVASEVGNISDISNHARQGIGGIYTLYLNPNQTYKSSPVHPVYELSKISCHLVLGLFVIIEPHLILINKHHDGSFYNDLNKFNQSLKLSLKSIGNIKQKKDINDIFHSKEIKQLIYNLLYDTIKYCDSVLINNKVDIKLFNKFSNKIKINIGKLMQIATDFQTKCTIKLLLKWKSMMTENEWKNLYVIIPTIWVTAKNSPREQIFRLLMNKDNVNTHLIIGENIFNQLEARKLCGRIVHDRLMSRFIFGINDIWSKRKCKGLGSKQDSLSDYCQNSIKKYINIYKSKL